MKVEAENKCGAVAVFIVLLFLIAGAYSYSVNAEPITCESFSTLIDLLSDNGCLVCDSCCPSRLKAEACDAGYSCQPDDDSGEEQQYPPAAVAAWIATLGCTNLTDITLDDPRWSEREENEVYIQESDKCLSIYWPKGGEARFDMGATLTNPAKWHDYLLSGMRPPKSGDATIRTGKQRITFNDGGRGGVTVFMAAPYTSPPVPPSTDFFTPYINPDVAKLPANRIFPIGQKMMLSMYNPNKVSDINEMHAHGLTAAGIWENAYGVGFDLDAVMKRVNELGMRSWLGMHMGRSPNNKPLTAVYGVCDGLKNGMTPEDIGEKINNIYSKYSKRDYAATVDARMHMPEEMGSRLETCDRGQLLKVNDVAIDNIMQHLPHVPIIKSETSSTSITSIDFNAVHRRISAPVRQFYFSDQSNLDIIPHALNLHIKLFNNLKANTTPDRPNIDKRIIGVIVDYNRDPASGDENRYTDYYVTTSLIKGVQSFSLVHYARFNPDPYPKVPSQKLKAAWFDTFKTITDCGITDAFIGGTDNPPGGKLTFTQVDGPDKSVKYKLPSMLAAERQYEIGRYVLMSNSHKDSSITVRVSGLPSSYDVRNCKTGDVSKITNQTSQDITIPVYGSVIYKISKGDM